MYTVKLIRKSTDEIIGQEKTFNTYGKAWDYALDMVNDDTYASIGTPDGDEFLV